MIPHHATNLAQFSGRQPLVVSGAAWPQGRTCRTHGSPPQRAGLSLHTEQLGATSGRLSQRRRLAPCGSADGAGSKYCVVLECDGVLVDIQGEGHRRAFNAAFEEIGYSCVSWTPPVYYDLMRLGDGTGPGLITTYYTMMGWPMMLSTSDRPAFVAKVYETKQRIIRAMSVAGEIPLRDGAVQFVDDLIAEGVTPVVLAGSASSAEDSVVSSAMYNLGISRATKVQVLHLGAGASASVTSSSGEGEEPQSPSMETLVNEAQSQAKSVAATSFARAINLQSGGNAGMRVDPNLLAAKMRAGMVSPAYFSAIMACMGSEAQNSTLVAASHSLMQAGKGAGMLVAGVPPSLASRGGYSAMDVGFKDGFGPGNLTWRRLKAMLDARKAF